ncbi:cholesterol 7-desaturase-like isoform X2 [Rhinatrema bivittatum]|uniref:cholesterol 7-desaturase-like isoform X2 n=1 Tax=Rhinatrema bivittatum TaxID=194408 RepID=UPI00112A7782|nr:cholesterol 7-desaturase-like isoform X2 [Rhinatrema bivittatum]
MESVPRSFFRLSVLCLGAVLLLGTAAGFLLGVQQLLQEAAPPPPVSPSSLPVRPAAAVAALSLLLLLLLWACRRLRLPVERLRSLEEVGYIPESGRSRLHTANEVRRRRKKGDLPPVYPNGWYQLLDAHLLRREEVKNISVLGEQVALYRTWEGQVYVVDAYCPHLGANLAVGGRVIGNCIECPFHGWQFSGEDGKCTRIPYAEKVPEFAKIKTWPSCEINGMICIWYHCDGLEPTWSIPEQEEITSKEWVYRGRTEHYVNAHIEEIPENAADIAHLSHLHAPGIVSGVDLRYTNSKLWEFVKHTWKVQWHPEPEPNKHCSQMLLEHALTLFGKHCALLDVHVVARQFERDVMIWNNKKYISKPLLIKEDSAIQRHRRCNQMLGKLMEDTAFSLDFLSTLEHSSQTVFRVSYEQLWDNFSSLFSFISFKLTVTVWGADEHLLSAYTSTLLFYLLLNIPYAWKPQSWIFFRFSFSSTEKFFSLHFISSL